MNRNRLLMIGVLALGLGALVSYVVYNTLRKTVASTNVIESAFSIVEKVCKNVKRWHGGDQRERWVGSGLLVAEKQFRRIQGHKQIPALIKELAALTPSKQAVVKRRKVS